MAAEPLRALIVDDEPLAVERLQLICARIPALAVVGTASDGEAALRLIEALHPDLVLLDVTMPQLDGLGVARQLAGGERRPMLVFVTAHDNFAVAAFDLEAADYVLKPVSLERLERAVVRAAARLAQADAPPAVPSPWITEFWVPQRSELIRLDAGAVERIDAERDYVRLHVGGRSYLLLHTIAGLEARLDPVRFIRLHRSTIVRRDLIAALRHDGLGAWTAELSDGSIVRIGRTYLAKAKEMTGR